MMEEQKEGGFWRVMEDLRVGEFNVVNLRGGWDQQVIRDHRIIRVGNDLWDHRVQPRGTREEAMGSGRRGMWGVCRLGWDRTAVRNTSTTRTMQS